MEQPLISVIVPVYNVEPYLCQCVDSILNQTYSNLEVILVDDGSPDNCPKLCDVYARQDSRVRAIHKPNGGLSDARNAALEICTGDYIAFVDSDDWIEPDMFAEMMKMMFERKTDIVFCTVREVVDGKQAGVRYRYFPDGTVLPACEVQKRALKCEIAAAVWMRLCRRDCFEQVRFPVGRNYEDIAVTFLPFEHAEQVGFIDRPFYNYRINKSGIAHQKKPLTRYQMFLSYRDCYEYSRKNVPDSQSATGVLAARFALGTFLDCEIEKDEILDRHRPEVESFLKEHRDALLEEWEMPPTLRLAFRLYFNAKIVFAKAYVLALPLLKIRWAKQSQ